MFTPQRLFGEFCLPPNTLSHEPFLERARVQREQDRDASARLALGGYVVARLIDKLLLLENDAELIEAFRWQLQAVRRHVGELPGDAPETAHLAGVVNAVPEQGSPTSSLWKSLTAYAYFLEHEERLEEALELLTLAARTQGPATPWRTLRAYALFAGRLNRLLARWDAATACYSAAEEAGGKAGDPVARLRGRLGQGAVDRGRGNLPMARTTAEAVVREARCPGSEGCPGDGLRRPGCGVWSAGAASSKRWEPSIRPSGSRTIRNSGCMRSATWPTGCARLGRWRHHARRSASSAHSSASVRVRANAHLELMDLESTLGNRVAFERCRAAAEEYRSRMSPSMSVDYYYKLGTGLSRFDQAARADDALSTALALAETHQPERLVLQSREGARGASESPPSTSSSLSPTPR